MESKLSRDRSAAVGKGKGEKQSVAELPENLIDDILSRLPVKDLLRFRCVSKQWCALIDSPIFIKLQLNRSLESGTNLSLIYWDNEIYSVDLDVLDGVLTLGSTSSVPRSDVVEVHNPIKSSNCWTIVEGSCNGLILLHLDESLFLGYETIALLNPSTKEYIILPPAPTRELGYHTFHGLMYDPVGDDYKVIKLAKFFDFDSHSFCYEVLVYGLRSNMWRRICERLAYSLCLPWEETQAFPGVLVNGALHWLALFDIVVAFDPVDEHHYEVRLPQVSSFSYEYGTLGVLGGCLCILYSMTINDEDRNAGNPVDLWVMNGYMVEKSWTKLFRLTLSDDVKRYSLTCARVLAYSKTSREVILLQMFGNLIWYDLKEKRVVYLGIHSFATDVNVKSLVKLTHDQ